MHKISRLSGLLIIMSSVLMLAAIYGYHQKVLLPPQSVHHWRQSDCASITYNYYNQDLGFRQPHIMGLVSDSGSSAINYTSEIPLYYWGVAQLYQVFGPREAILRGANTVLFLGGLISFIYSLWLVSGSLLWALMGGLMLFSSPVLVYYGNNYLSNAPAFGMALIALSMLMHFFRTTRKIYWWLSVLFFLFAGSLKLPGLFLFFALAGAVFLFPGQFKFIHRKTIVISAFIILTPIVTWLWYARALNEAHHTVYFSTTIFPIWELSREDITFILSEIKKFWLSDYGHWSYFAFFLLLLLSVLFSSRTRNRSWLSILILLVSGLLVFSLLQFYTFMQHDYYLINMYILPALIVVGFSVGKSSSSLLRSPVLLIIMLLLLIFNVNYAAERHQFRYKGFHNDYRKDYAVLYEGLDSWLTEAGVSSADSVIFISDDSHTSLYLLRRFGWTTHKMAFKDTAKTLYFNRDSAGIAESINSGADYLIMLNWRELFGSRSYLLPFTRHRHAQIEDLMVFDLKDTTKNFTLPRRQLATEIILEPDSMNFVSNKGEVIEFAEAITGNKVLQIQVGDVYNLTQDFTDLKAGMTVVFTAWINADAEKKVVPVIASLEPGLAFVQRVENLQERNGWRQLQSEYWLSEEVAQAGIRCFLWNPEGATARLDHLVIEVYEAPK